MTQNSFMVVEIQWNRLKVIRKQNVDFGAVSFDSSFSQSEVIITLSITKCKKIYIRQSYY